jgi:hypothetical protein
MSGRGGKRDGAGRKAGGRNAVSVENAATISELAKAYTQVALTALVDVAKSGSDAARVSAANSILDRAYGKPAQTIELDDDGEEAQVMTFNIAMKPAVKDVNVTKPE